MKAVLKADYGAGVLSLEIPASSREGVARMMKDVTENYGGFLSVDLKKPYKPRTTGKGSQNSLIWALIQFIAGEIGEDVEEIEKQAKYKAISKGYPYHVSKLTGKPVPESMTKIDTVQASCLIETLYEISGFCGLVLPPELQGEKK